MGLFALLARFLPRLTRREQKPQFAYAPIAPQRLERRRVLDAAGAGLALEAIPDAQPFVQTASMTTADESPDQQTPPAAIHGGPHATIRLRDTELFEDQATLAVVNITDNFPMAHQVTIDWGDGSALTVINAGANQRDVLASHKFLDDPTGPGDGSFTVTATVTNSLGESATTTTTILVKNIAPQIDSLAITSPINENGTAVLTGTYSDTGTLDTHTLDIDWDGDGTFDQSVTVTGGTFSVGRQILDDNPTGTSDTFNVNVRLRDDDGGEATGAVPLTVRNVAPVFTNLSLTSPVTENGTATLTGTYTDTGTQDTHTLDIDWNGDGTFDQTVAVSGGSFSVTHQFLDDNPTGVSDTFAVLVRLRDDDGGQALRAVEITVSNANPTVVLNAIDAINENGTAVLTGTYSDAGSLDTHTLDIDWDGDGTFEQTVAVTGGAFTVTWQFLDDNPSGTASDTSTVNVRLRDDDGDVASASTSVEVFNVDPDLVLVPPSTIDENQVATLNGTITDAGTLDTFTLLVIWGDPASSDDLQVFSLGATQLTKAADGIDWDPTTRQFSIDHQYLDDIPTNTPLDTYTIQVAVGDDDTGADIEFTSVTVRNVDPVLANVAVTSPVVENGMATLTGTYTDTGTRDTHTLDIDWDGDGTFDQTVAVSGGSFTVSHQFLDDNPTGTSDTFNVNVRLRDDDGGADTATVQLTVENANPVLTIADDQTVDEGAVLNLNDGKLGRFTDPGIRDTHTATVNWGDGSGTHAVSVSEANGSGNLSASHIYADNGVYTVTVTLTDDDGGRVTDTFQVTVANVAPTLTGADSPINVEEGDLVTLASLGVGIQDPGFDNPSNPLPPGGSHETLSAISIDWGDGTGPQALGIGTETDGGPNVPTIATLTTAQHAFADNGTYTVKVTVKDDDGSEVTREFTIIVNNVDPTLDIGINRVEIKEGESIDLSGMFSDAGFDNDANPNGRSQENLRYEINWGDGSAPGLSGDLPDTPGSQGVPTTGSFVVNHVYADNDEDNLYTITVKLFDDDGGSVEKQLQIRVLNVNPSLSFVGATDVTAGGLATFTLTFDDPGTERLLVHIDWGDDKPDAIWFDPSTTGTTHTFEHRYDRPPNPANPAAPITIKAFVTDDDFGVSAVVEPGISNEVSATIKNPGIGAEPFRIDTTPRVPQLTFPVRDVPLFVANNAGATFSSQQTFVLGGSAGEAPAASYRYFELRVIDAEGNEGPGHPLPPNVLEDLPALFRTLPDNHYAIYVVNTETNVPRLVIEVYVRNGKMIDPGDDSEGTRDRPPTDEQKVEPAATVPAEAAPVTVPVDEGAGPADEGAGEGDQAQLAVPMRFPTHRFSRWTALAVGLAASASAQSWAHRVDEALAKASAEQWRKLQSHNPPKPKKP